MPPHIYLCAAQRWYGPIRCELSLKKCAGKSSFVLSIVSKFDAVAYLNLSKYGSCNSIDDLVQLLTEQFNIWYKTIANKTFAML